MPFASGLSEHPVTAFAVGEVVGQVLERVGAHPDLAILFVSPHHAGALEDAAGAVAELLGPSVMIGGASDTVVGTGREVERSPAVSLWAGRFGPVSSLRVRARPTPEGVELDGVPDASAFVPRLLVVVADPWTFPAEDFLAVVRDRWPGLPVVGGMVSGSAAAGTSRLLVDGRVLTDGAVGALVGPGLSVDVVVSQGCRPVGVPLVVTGSDGQLVRELAGRPALSRIDELAGSLSPDEIALVNRAGLHVGRVVDEHKATFGRGDFLVRNVLGGDRASGAIAVNDLLEVGTTVQFHLRDAAAAHDDLVAAISERPGGPPGAALLFTCNGRGERLFGRADHDAAALTEAFGPLPTVGMASAGELGPVGGRNFLHGFTASIALLDDGESPGGASAGSG